MSEWLMLGWQCWLTLVRMVLMSVAACWLTNGRLQRKLHFLIANIAEALESFLSDSGGKLLTLSRQMALNELSSAC